MKERLEKILFEYNLSPSRLADQMGIQRSGISHIMSGRNKPSFDFLTSLLELFPEIDANWLLTGKGKMLKTEDNAIDLERNSQNQEPVLQQLFTDEHFNQGKSAGKQARKAEIPPSQSPSGYDISSHGPGDIQIDNSGEVEKVILLLKNGKFKSFEKDSEKS